MTLHIDTYRRDGKYQVRYCYDNGTVLRKIATRGQVLEAIAKADTIYNHTSIDSEMASTIRSSRIGETNGN